MNTTNPLITIVLRLDTLEFIQRVLDENPLGLKVSDTAPIMESIRNQIGFALAAKPPR